MFTVTNAPKCNREPRGFGFVKFRNAEDAAEAKQQLNHQVIGGREITIVYAEENRKTPQEMRTTARIRYFFLLGFPHGNMIVNRCQLVQVSFVVMCTVVNL